MWKNVESFLNEDTTLEYDQSQNLTPKESIYAVLALLLKVGHVSSGMSSIEIEKAVEFASKEFDHGEGSVRGFVETADFLARDTKKLDSFLDRIHTDFSKGQKQEILKGLWKVIKSDGVVDLEEGTVAGEIRKLLGLTLEEALFAQKTSESS